MLAKNLALFLHCPKFIDFSLCTLNFSYSNNWKMKLKQSWTKTWVKHKICGICKGHKSPFTPRLCCWNGLQTLEIDIFLANTSVWLLQLRNTLKSEVNSDGISYTRTCNICTEEISIPKTRCISLLCPPCPFCASPAAPQNKVIKIQMSFQENIPAEGRQLLSL